MSIESNMAVDLAPRGTNPLRCAFIITSMPVGGAETLLVNLLRGFHRTKILPELICLKELGPLGETLASEIPTLDHVLSSKRDLRVLPRLIAHFRRNRIDAIVTVGAGDKMFWGRLAARLAGVRVICSALHSTGWPDGVGRLNRWLTSITDAFIAVAKPHGEFLVDFERFPKRKVFVIPNGIDTQRFCSSPAARAEIRAELGISPSDPVVGIVAALRQEKNHELFIQAAANIVQIRPKARFIIVGDGPEREKIQSWIQQKNLNHCVHLLGTRSDTPRILAGLDVFALTSHNEANPVSILEALSCEVPVVATRVGSVSEMVREEETGYLVQPGDAAQLTSRLNQLLDDPQGSRAMGARGREHVKQAGSLDSMIEGYETLICSLHRSKTQVKKPMPSIGVPSLQLPFSETASQ